MKEEERIIIFTDGGAINNPGPGGWGAVILEDGKVTELGGGEDTTTNNRMEMTAIVKALSKIKNTKKQIVLYTDSSYVLNGATKWVSGWQRNGWVTKNKNEVLNKDLWEQILELTNKLDIDWQHVPSHVGIPGNERVDEIATSFAGKKKLDLYKGAYLDYKINLFDLSFSEEKKKSKSRSKKEAYSYLSLVDGIAIRHTDWKSCEARVKGVKAKFKKAFSVENEKEILQEWGVNIEDVN